jgi:hypothetical protein
VLGDLPVFISGNFLYDMGEEGKHCFSEEWNEPIWPFLSSSSTSLLIPFELVG